jgi:hypothetical protein
MKEGDGKLKTTFVLAPGMENSMLDRQASGMNNSVFVVSILVIFWRVVDPDSMTFWIRIPG